MDHLLPREPRALGEALGQALASERLRLRFGRRASNVSFERGRFVVGFDDAPSLDAERLLIATGRRPRVAGIGPENVGIEPRPRGIPVDGRMSAGDGVWAIGDVTGIWPLTYVGLRILGRVTQHLMPGDVVLLPTSTPHELVSSVDARTDSLARFETDTRRTPHGDMVIQGPGARTRVLCAAYDYDHEVAHPLMSQLPPVLYIPAGMPGDDGGVAATLRLLALELGGRPPGSRAAVGRLIDVMLIHAMRAWLHMHEDDAPTGGCSRCATRSSPGR